MAPLTFLDTNVLAYVYDDGQPDKRAEAAKAIDSVVGAVISTQVLLELFSVLTRKLHVSPSDALTQIEDLMHLQVIPTDTQLVREAITLTLEHGISHWDAMIVAAASRAGCDELLTEDLRHGQVIAGVRVINPFRGDRDLEAPSSPA